MGMKETERDNRSIERVPIPLEVTGEVTVYQPMTILNLSEAGAQIEAPFALEHDSFHDFRLSLNDRAVIVKGRIAYCQISELRDRVVLYRCGVEFVDPSPQALAALRDFVGTSDRSTR